MKSTILALPTVLLIAVAITLANAPHPSAIPADLRAQQLHQLDRDAQNLRARRLQLEAQPAAPFLPR